MNNESIFILNSNYVTTKRNGKIYTRFQIDFCHRKNIYLSIVELLTILPHNNPIEVIEIEKQMHFKN
jgi:hypothetical protein